MNYLTKEEIEQEIRAYFNKESTLKAFEDAMPKHYVWQEDGTKCSAWEIKAGGMSILTGDGGMEMYLKELKKAFYGQL